MVICKTPKRLQKDFKKTPTKFFKRVGGHLKNTEKRSYDAETRKQRKHKKIGMVKYGVPDDVLDPKKTKKAGDVVVKRNTNNKYNDETP